MNIGTKGTKPMPGSEYSFEEIYKTLFEQAADGVFIANELGRFVEVNPSGCEMLGYSRDEILQMTIQDLIPAHEIERIPLQLDVLRTGKKLLMERTILHKDGSYLPVEISGSMLLDGRILGLLRDISKRKQFEAEILHLARFPSENPNPVLRVSLDGKILYANESSANLLDKWNTEIGEQLPSELRKLVKRLAGKGSSENVDFVCEDRIYSFAITPVPGTDYINLYGNDVTKSRLGESALREVNEKYRNIFDHSLDGIFQSTPSGRFITVNPALARICGYESPEAVIEGITNIAHQIYVKSEQREEFLRLMDENSEVQDFEFQVYRKDGSVIWVQENVRSVRDAEGKVQYYEGTIKDITEQKQILAALRRSEERYRSTLNNMMEGCQIIDYDWRYIYVNDTAAMHGRRKPEEMLMRTMMELYPGIENTELFAVLQRCMDKRIPERIENEFTFPNGENGWFELGIQPVPEGLFILSLDISERKQAERDLRDREARYRTLFENLPISVFTKDRDGRYTSCNAEEEKYWDKNPVGFTDHDLLPAEIANNLRANDLEVMEKRESWSGEEEFQSPTGLHHTLVRKAPLYDGNGHLIGVLGASVDITKRKQAELKLLESEERYRDLVDNSQELICTHDLEGKILSVNPWASKTLGYEQDELLEMNIADFLLPEYRSDFQNYLVEIKKNRRAQGIMVVQTRSGEHLILEFNNSLRLEGVEQPVVRGMAHDVTHQKKAEIRIKQQLARLTALREIDRFITSSFELNRTLDMLVREVTRQLNVDAASIWLVDVDSNMLEFATGTGFQGVIDREHRLKIGDNYAGQIVLEQKMIQIPDMSKSDSQFRSVHFSSEEKFSAYYGLPLISKGAMNGVLEIFHRSPLEPDEEWLSYLETLSGQAAIAIDNAQLFNNLQQSNTELTLAYDATIEGWSYALDLRDKETEGHTQRVTEITYKLCEKFGMSESELTYVRWGALLHDIGKMGIPDSILLKPGKLSDDEWVIMKMHPTFARKMLERVNYLKSAIDIPYYHHERWDGSGYPEGLEGEQIPLTARIFAVADVWDALTSDRPYRPAWSKKDALKYIESVAGTHLDPQVVEVFLDSKDLWKISSEQVR